MKQSNEPARVERAGGAVWARVLEHRHGRASVTTHWRERVATTAVLLGVGLLAMFWTPAVQAATPQDSGGGDGVVQQYSYSSLLGAVPYLVYVPASYKAGDHWPLLVMLHGCGVTAQEQMDTVQANPLADSQHFIVVYPNSPIFDSDCWRAFYGDPTSINRGEGGDADIVAGITKTTMARYGSDPQRIYMIGMSSGAFQTSATAAAYPDLYAAIGQNAGGGYGMNISCAALTDSIVPGDAQLALDQESSRARVMPFFAIGGTADPLGYEGPPGGCTRMAFEQWMDTDNLVLAHDGSGDSIAIDPAATVNGQVPNGHSWTKQVYENREGCEIGEQWMVDGMAHYWSGGSSDPSLAAYSDPKGPSATDLMWRFLSQFTLAGSNSSCPATSAAPTGSLVSLIGLRANHDRVSVTHAGVLHLRLTCSSHAVGACRGRIALSRRRATAAATRFVLGADKTRSFRLSLSKATRRLLMTQHRLAIQVTVRTSDTTVAGKVLRRSVILIMR